MQKNDTCFNFALTEHLKQDKPGNVFGNVLLYKYTVGELYVYETIYIYLRATEKLKNSSKLLVSFIKSASTIRPGRGGTSHLTDFDETWPV